MHWILLVRSCWFFDAAELCISHVAAQSRRTPPAQSKKQNPAWLLCGRPRNPHVIVNNAQLGPLKDRGPPHLKNPMDQKIKPEMKVYVALTMLQTDTWNTQYKENRSSSVLNDQWWIVKMNLKNGPHPLFIDLDPNFRTTIQEHMIFDWHTVSTVVITTPRSTTPPSPFGHLNTFLQELILHDNDKYGPPPSCSLVLYFQYCLLLLVWTILCW